MARLTIRRLVDWFIGLLISSALAGVATGQTDEASRRIVELVSVTESSLTEELEFVIPPDTRSVTFQLTGPSSSLIGLYSFTQADGVDVVGVHQRSPSAEMKRRYYDEEISYMPSKWPQTMRLGTFVSTFPYRERDTVVPGRAKVKFVATGAGASPVKLTILMPKKQNVGTLRINLISLSNSFNPAVTSGETARIEREVNRIFNQAGIEVVIVKRLRFRNSRFRRLTDFHEPQETPDSQAAKMASTYGALVEAPGALNIYVVDGLEAAGISLGIPGSPDPLSYYFGVVLLRSTSSTSFARVIAHEICHFLGLHHVTNRALSGRIYNDPLPDTTIGEDNLMDSGTNLTPQQVFAIRQSPLLD